MRNFSFLQETFLAITVYPSIQFFHPSRAGSWWQQVKQDNPHVPPRPDEMFNPSSVFWVYPRASKGRGPDAEPTQLAPFDMQEWRLYSKVPLDVWAPQPISKTSHYMEDSVSHYPKLMTKVWYNACLPFFFFTLIPKQDSEIHELLGLG